MFLGTKPFVVQVICQSHPSSLVCVCGLDYLLSHFSAKEHGLSSSETKPALSKGESKGTELELALALIDPSLPAEVSTGCGQLSQAATDTTEATFSPDPFLTPTLLYISTPTPHRRNRGPRGVRHTPKKNTAGISASSQDSGSQDLISSSVKGTQRDTSDYKYSQRRAEQY